jgi:hypothetical protein
MKTASLLPRSMCAWAVTASAAGRKRRPLVGAAWARLTGELSDRGALLRAADHAPHSVLERSPQNVAPSSVVIVSADRRRVSRSAEVRSVFAARGVASLTIIGAVTTSPVLTALDTLTVYETFVKHLCGWCISQTAWNQPVPLPSLRIVSPRQCPAQLPTRSDRGEPTSRGDRSRWDVLAANVGVLATTDAASSCREGNGVRFAV